MTASFVHNCTENDIRLVGGTSPLEGRVEVCVNGDWGTVTHDNWDYRDASVACRQLGFSPLGSYDSCFVVSLLICCLGAVDLNYGGFGQGTGQAIVLDNIRCLGNETALTSCFSSIPRLDSHFEDAGIRCKPGIAKL